MPRLPTREMVQAVETMTGYHFEDVTLLLEAFQAPKSLGALPDGNKRLALFGDAALKLAFIGDWFEGGQPRGTLSFPKE